MVQKEAEGSVEELIPSHSNESGNGVFASNGSGVALMAKALVEFQDGPTNATGRGDGVMEDLPGRFSGASLVRIGQSSQFRGEENYGESTSGNQLVWECLHRETDPSAKNQGIPGSNQFTTKGDGYIRARSHFYNPERPNLDQPKRDEMELDLARENFGSSR